VKLYNYIFIKIEFVVASIDKKKLLTNERLE